MSSCQQLSRTGFNRLASRKRENIRVSKTKGADISMRPGGLGNHSSSYSSSSSELLEEDEDESSGSGSGSAGGGA